jgi:hypothetical protein
MGSWFKKFSTKNGCEELDISGIPTEFDITLDEDVKNLAKKEIEYIISNIISEIYGFCHFGFDYKEIFSDEEKEKIIEDWLSIFAV